MNFQDEDIKFEMLNWMRFEELCFDLLLKHQFYSLSWNKGGSDGGRDIEAKFAVSNPITGFYEEKWFIECKHYTQPLNKSNLSEKIEQATAEDIDHFLLITSSYLTKDTKRWLDNKRLNLKFKVHVLEGKNLKKKLLAFPQLISQYFADNTTRLVKEVLRQWLIYDIFPDVKTLHKFSKEIDPSKLALEELVFLVYSYEKLDFDFDEYPDDNLEEFSFDFLIPYIINEENRTFPVLTPEEIEIHDIKYFKGINASRTGKMKGEQTENTYYHALIPINKIDLLEIYFIKDINKRLDVRVGVYRNKS